MDTGLLPEALPLLSIGGSVGIISAALALGIRHGIDWDHIAAITDITSTTAALDEKEAALVREPALMLTDESHHAIGHEHEGEEAATATPSAVQTATARTADAHRHEPLPLHHPHHHRHDSLTRERPEGAFTVLLGRQRPALLLGTMYALGHGAVVLVLGLTAILARGFLPDWIDPVMERVVGVTLLFLAAYLFYSLYRYFRGEGDFQLRSRWMLVFAGVRNLWGALREKLFGHPHEHTHEAQSYGVRTAVGIGVIHGIGAETGTQALVIATAVGAQSQAAGIVALVAFLVGLLISNSIVTVVSTAGFVSSAQRKWIYVAAGMLAAVFSLIVGLVFVFQSTEILPEIDPYIDWIGGPQG
jgi:high-affinity nickel-transport protein